MTPVAPRDTPMSPEAVAALPAPGILGTLLGIARLALAGGIVVLATVVILASSLVPLKIRDTRLSLWVTAITAHALLAVFGIRLIVDDRERLRAHRGFVFFNHFSWIDPVVLMADGPKVKAKDLALQPPRDSAAKLEEMSLEDVECFLIKKTLSRHNGNVSQAAASLGLSRSALYRRLQRYGL